MNISTTEKRQIVDITEDVQQEVILNSDGICSVTVLHTTAAITTVDLDPGTDKDFLDFLSSLIPDLAWRHPHDPSHAPDHFLASLIGPSVIIPVEHGKLILGQWQRIVLVECDGPRERAFNVTVVARR